MHKVVLALQVRTLKFKIVQRNKLDFWVEFNIPPLQRQQGLVDPRTRCKTNPGFAQIQVQQQSDHLPNNYLARTKMRILKNHLVICLILQENALLTVAVWFR